MIADDNVRSAPFSGLRNKLVELTFVQRVMAPCTGLFNDNHVSDGQPNYRALQGKPIPSNCARFDAQVEQRCTVASFILRHRASTTDDDDDPPVAVFIYTGPNRSKAEL